MLSWAACLDAAAQPVTLTANGQTTVTAFPSNLGLPHWSGGALVGVDNPMNQSNRMPAFGVSPVIHIFDAQGAEVRTVSLAIPDANVIWVRGAAHGSDGAVAVCGQFAAQYPSEPGHVLASGGGYLALFSAGNSTPLIVRTDPYAPFGVTLAPDGTVWTVGAEFEPVHGNPIKTSDGLIRHFDAQGKLLASVLPQNSLPFRTLQSGSTNMASSAYGAAWYQGSSGLYYEITADGKMHNYPGLPLSPVAQGGAMLEDITGLALTDTGTAFISKMVFGPKYSVSLYTLDRAQGVWVAEPLPAGGSPATLNFMYGGDGNTVVMQTDDRTGLGMRFFTVGAQ
jgi:hypothetical protein